MNNKKKHSFYRSRLHLFCNSKLTPASRRQASSGTLLFKIEVKSTMVNAVGNGSARFVIEQTKSQDDFIK